MKTNHHKFTRPLVFFIGFLMLTGIVSSQYVTIPDTAFVSWLNANGYSTCLNGNQLDTTCNALLGSEILNCYAVPIRDLTGIQYFKNLYSLDCSNDSLYSLPTLPTNLISLNCQHNHLTALPALPPGLQSLTCSYNFNLGNLPALPSGLLYLVCYSNNLDSLADLPPSLQTLYCDLNNLTKLPSLPQTVQYLTCSSNQIRILPILPDSLLWLDCSENILDSLPALPTILQQFWCQGDFLSSVPALPATLSNFECGNNELTNLPVLPPSLQILVCNNNFLSGLPTLPDSLNYLDCSSNQIDSLPVLPSMLYYWLDCSYNHLTSLPALPDSMYLLDCSFNQLNDLSNLPLYAFYFYCNNNPNLGCLPKIGTIRDFNFDSTGVACLPNYGTVLYSTPSLNAVPLCSANNPNNCQSFWNITGQAFLDTAGTCQYEQGEGVYRFVRINLTEGGVLLQQAFTDGGGYYSFDVDTYGIYQVSVDTVGLPLLVLCPANDTLTDTITASNLMEVHQDFSLACPPGFDLGVRSIWSRFKPGNNSLVHILAGDVSDFYNAHCAAGTNGSVTVIFSGPVTYVGPPPGALTPTTVSGDTLTWAISDFGAVNPDSDFNIILNTNYSATGGDQVCFAIWVLPIVGDNNPANNTFSQCFTVLDALDPNHKDVSPAGNIDTAQQWLTYTISFQNTGTAPAGNIVVNDTLDASHLDLSSIQLLAYSSEPKVRVLGNGVVQFDFANINLPDSNADFTASQGYLQFKVKLLGGLPLGTQVNNTGYIYFDYNPAVATNTAGNLIGVSTGIVPVSNNTYAPSLNLYPNPARNYVVVETGQSAIGGTLLLTDLTGRQVMNTEISNTQFKIPTTGLMSGVYFVKVSDTKQQSAVRKLVIE